MKITINAQDLIYALNTTKPTFERGAKSFACAVYLETTPCDREVIIRTERGIKITTRIPCATDGGLGGKIALTHKDLLDLAKAVKSGDLTLIAADDDSGVSCEIGGRLFASLPSAPWFDSLPEEEDPLDTGALVNLADFKTTIQNAVLCLGDKYEESLSCISFKPCVTDNIVEIAALDGHKFFMKSLAAPDLNASLAGDQRLLPHGEKLAAWLKALPGKLETTLEIQSTKDLFIFRCAGSTFTAQTAPYCFPDYDNFLAKRENMQATFEVYNDQLISTLTSLKPFVHASDRSFRFDFDSAGHAASITAGIFTEGKKASRMVEGTYKGNLAKIYFPLLDVLDICQALGNGKKKGTITFLLTGKEKPAFITNDTCQDSLFILMPMQLERMEQEWEMTEEAPVTQENAA